MPTAPANRDAHDYAERIRERLPGTLRELRQARGLTMHALEKKSGVSREMIWCIEEGATIPTFHVGAVHLTEPRNAFRAKPRPRWAVANGAMKLGDNFFLPLL